MAYEIKYLFKFESVGGTTREIRVLQEGYAGDVIQRPLGRAPILKKEQNGPVHGTSLEFFAECNVNQEFIEFYTSDPKEYRVDLYAGATLLWQGYITPELYREPDIAPPYDVQVVATDGVGELKLYDFAAQGTVSLRALLTYLLGYTGLGTDVYLISSLKAGSRGAGALLGMTINFDYMAGKTCYDVLTYLLDTLHASITWWKGAWILTRETNVTYTSGKVRYFNVAGNSALLADSVQTLGVMYTNDAWPVGQLTTDIDPAKNSVVVQAPWHLTTGLTNPDMTSDTGWTKTSGVEYVSGSEAYHMPSDFVGPSTSDVRTLRISQTIAFTGLRVPMTLATRVTGIPADWDAVRDGSVIGVNVTYTVGASVYVLTKGKDGTAQWTLNGSRMQFQKPVQTYGTGEIGSEVFSLEIPPFVQGNAYSAGTLEIQIEGACIYVYSAHLDVVLPRGYQDILSISNGARGEGSTVEIAIGKETSDISYYQAFLQGLLLDSGALITSFTDANITTGSDFLSFIAKDYAMSVALPRARVTGTVFLESAVQIPPLVFAKGGLDYWLETWSWNLYEDELEISARTLPSASLTVSSEVIKESDGSTVSSASSSSGSSGGGGSMSGLTLASVWNSLTNAVADAYASTAIDAAHIPDLSDVYQTKYPFTLSGTSGATYNLAPLATPWVKVGTTQIALGGQSKTLAGLTSVTSEKYYLNSSTYFELDSDGYVHLVGSFYADGFVSAGGLSSGGGTSGIDLAAMWGSLTNTNTDAYANTKIHANHIPDMASTYGYAYASALSSYLLASTAASTYQPIISDLATIRSNAANGNTAYSSLANYLPLTGGMLSIDSNEGFIVKKTTNNVSLIQFRGTISNVETVMGSLGFVGANNPVFSNTDNTRYTLYHSGNFNPGDYLPLSAGSSYPLTGALTINAPGNEPLVLNNSASGGTATFTRYKLARSVVATIGYDTTGTFLKNNSVTGTPYVNIASDGVFKYKNTNPFYHSGNSNKSDVAWTCSTLTASIVQASSQNAYVLTLNNSTTGATFVGAMLSLDSTNKGILACGTDYGMAILNIAAGHKGIGVTDAGVPYYGNSSTKYTLYHTGNCNNYSTAWTCSTLATSGAATVGSSITATGRITANAASEMPLVLNNTISGGTSCYIRFQNEGTAKGTIGVVSGSVYIGGNNITLANATTLSSTLSVTGAATFGSTITASGDITFENISGYKKLYYRTADATAKMYVADNSSTGYTNETIALQTCFNAQDPETSSYVGSYPARCVLALQPRGGYVGINNTNPQYTLDVSGIIHSTTGIFSDGYVSGGGLSTSSDQRLKDNIQPFAYTPALLMAIQPREWDWNGKTPMTGHAAGFVAQEIEPLMPYAVTERNYKQLYYDMFHAVEIAGLQDHETRIRDLERENKELRERLNLN